MESTGTSFEASSQQQQDRDVTVLSPIRPTNRAAFYGRPLTAFEARLRAVSPERHGVVPSSSTPAGLVAASARDGHGHSVGGSQTRQVYTPPPATAPATPYATNRTLALRRDAAAQQLRAPEIQARQRAVAAATRASLSAQYSHVPPTVERPRRADPLLSSPARRTAEAFFPSNGQFMNMSADFGDLQAHANRRGRKGFAWVVS
jgi:hypothetical protein